jgi:hypothetical protein
VIGPLNPLETVVVTVDVPLAPCATETAPGAADSTKFGADPATIPLIRFAPFGLPQPVTRS